VMRLARDRGLAQTQMGGEAKTDRVGGIVQR
jgi:hypothetical protein